LKPIDLPLLILLPVLLAASCPSTNCSILRTENFTTEPNWIGMGNRYSPGCREVIQDFGYSDTDYCGGQVGEVGGQISRSVTPAYYATPIEEKTLDDTLDASGRIVLVKDMDGGCFIGWFNHRRQGWRPFSFLGFRLDGRNVYLCYTTRTWRAQGLGTEVSLVPGKPTAWKIHYDPAQGNETGSVTLTIEGKRTTLRLLPGHREDGAIFDRFGIFNLQEPGGFQRLYIDDLALDGLVLNFSTDPGWEGCSNRASFRDCLLRGTQDFGYSETNFSGCQEGEIGGLIWRSERPAFYADEVGVLTLEDRLVASGVMTLVQASSDSGFLVGWFDPKDLGWPPSSFLGFVMEGPSRIGHQFRLIYHTPQGLGGESQDNPILFPNSTVYRWNIEYDPSTRIFSGRIEPGGEVFLTVDPDGNATFALFGMLNIPVGGHQATAYLDDLAYTVSISELPITIALPTSLLLAVFLASPISLPDRRTIAHGEQVF